ncbi:MAG TPA: threonine/serine exporter family protein, partial [Candidatus Limnocylindrales bacterium]|nr:threonine/serine exporter family protein [Candidatus Limnocylindrales bacterium]
MINAELLQTVALDFVLAAITSAGFAVLFSVPRRLLLASALLGGIAHSMRAALQLGFGLPVEWSTLAASMIIGIVAVLLL